jgi:hypothetical protein
VVILTIVGNKKEQHWKSGIHNLSTAFKVEIGEQICKDNMTIP